MTGFSRLIWLPLVANRLIVLIVQFAGRRPGRLSYSRPSPFGRPVESC